MAICTWCSQEMLDCDSCLVTEVEFPDGEKLDSLPYFGADEGLGSCHDCGVAEGGFHHPGCDNEECPRCHGQLISCDCLTVREDDE